VDIFIKIYIANPLEITYFYTQSHRVSNKQLRLFVQRKTPYTRVQQTSILSFVNIQKIHCILTYCAIDLTQNNCKDILEKYHDAKHSTIFCS